MPQSEILKPRPEDQQPLIGKLLESLTKYGLTQPPEIEVGKGEGELGLRLGEYQDTIRAMLKESAPTDAVVSMIMTAIFYLKFERLDLAQEELNGLIELLVNLNMEKDPIFTLVNELRQSILSKPSFKNYANRT